MKAQQHTDRVVELARIKYEQLTLYGDDEIQIWEGATPIASFPYEPGGGWWVPAWLWVSADDYEAWWVPQQPPK